MLAVPYMGAYTAAKFALEAMTEALYHEVRDEGIRVAIMQPSAMHMERPAQGVHLRIGKNVAEDSFSHKVVQMMVRDTLKSTLTPEQVSAKIYAVIRGKVTSLRVPMHRAAVLSKLKRLLPQRAIDGLISNLMKGAASI